MINTSCKMKKKLINIIASMMLCMPGAANCTDLTVPDSCMGEAKGWLAGEDTYYSIDIYWRNDIVFAYDQGYWNGANRVRSTDLVGAEKDGIDGAVGQWYGFDGVRNRIIVLNRSNANVVAKYSASVDAQVCGNETNIELYGHASNSNLALTMNSEDDLTSSPVDFGDDDDALARFGNETLVNANTGHVIKGTPKDGTLYVNKIFINVTGEPTNPNFSTLSSNPSNMGTVTITLSREQSNN